MSWRRDERSRWEDRDRDRERERRERRRRSASRERRRRRYESRDCEDVPPPPSPPTISRQRTRSRSPARSTSHSPRDRDTLTRDVREAYDTRDSRDSRREDFDKQDDQSASPGDWFCKCGLYNFKRRLVCYRRNCDGKRSDGIVFGPETDRNLSESCGITKCLRFRRLDALTTEEKILEAIKDRCSKAVLDSIAGITIGREALTGASKCLAYINFNSIADSTAAHSELLNLHPPLEIDGRYVLIGFYNGPKKQQKATADYSSYYNQMTATYASAGQTNSSLSEADRVNAAAAVAQSAIASAQARNSSWTPVTTPTFTTNITPPTKLPTGDGKTVYTPPDVRTFMYDEHSGYYYDPATGLYYDSTTQYFYNNQINQYMYWDGTTNTYILAPQSEQKQETTQESEAPKPPEEKKKKDKEDKVKVAKKIAKDMERWARTLNQKKENAKSNIVMEQVLDTAASKGSVDIGFSVLSAGPSVTHVREISPPVVAEDFLIKKVSEPTNFDNDDGIIDWPKLTCLLCKRKFPSADVLTKHKTMSDLHKQNLAEFHKKNELLPQINGYRDRAAERRMKFGEDETPIIRKRYEMPEVPVLTAGPAPSVVDTIGGKMLQKMGWSEGRGLGKSEQGRIAPIEAEQRPSLAGLGQKRGIYTPTPGETYRDTVKKLMIARYKEVVGQEDEK